MNFMETVDSGSASEQTSSMFHLVQHCRHEAVVALTIICKDSQDKTAYTEATNGSRAGILSPTLKTQTTEGLEYLLNLNVILGLP